MNAKNPAMKQLFHEAHSVRQGVQHNVSHMTAEISGIDDDIMTLHKSIADVLGSPDNY